MRFSVLLTIGLLTGAANPAEAQSVPVGIVADPCIAKLTPDQDWPNLCRYRADNATVAARPQHDRAVVFMGDSITRGWDLEHSPALGTGMINRGISGQTTPQMLARFMADVVALHPRAVHIMAGTNDLAGNTGPETEQDVKNNIVAMATLARANHIRVILASIPPARAFPWRPEVKPLAELHALNAWLRDYAKRTGAIYVDYGPALAAPDGGMRAEFSADGVHPDAAGYAAMAPVTKKAIAAALR